MRNKLASYAHEAWSGWMQYLFRFGTENEDGSFTINADKVQRWKRQMDTPYSNLSSEEKESDRREADKILNIVIEYIKELLEWI